MYGRRWRVGEKYRLTITSVRPRRGDTIRDWYLQLFTELHESGPTALVFGVANIREMERMIPALSEEFSRLRASDTEGNHVKVNLPGLFGIRVNKSGQPILYKNKYINVDFLGFVGDVEDEGDGDIPW